MHPILSSRRGVALYLTGWIPLVSLAAALIIDPRIVGWRETSFLVVPLAVVHAFMALASWYPCKVVPLRDANLIRLVAMHAVGAAASSALWVILGSAIARSLDLLLAPVELEERFKANLALLFILGALLYILAVAIQYLLIAIETSREAEKRALGLKVLAREAELRALRAQIDPHFLFNTLNTISALCGSDPQTARSMSLLLADFLRSSLRFGAQDRIPLITELLLARSYLAVERIRFGPRLEIDEQIGDDVREVRVPPLILQPLVENAVNHGIGHLIAGGTIQLGAVRRGEAVEIFVENDCDPDRPASRGTGIGLRNVEQRLESIYGRKARVVRTERDGRYRVQLTIPLTQEVAE